MRVEAHTTTFLSEATEAVSVASPAPAVAEPAKPVEPGAFEKILARASDEVNAHERQIHGLAHAGQAPALGPEELLALQSDVYRYSATVDLTSKVVSQGTQGVQTVLKGGGQ